MPFPAREFRVTSGVARVNALVKQLQRTVHGSAESRAGGANVSR